jgi:hypothetical protein
MAPWVGALVIGNFVGDSANVDTGEWFEGSMSYQLQLIIMKLISMPQFLEMYAATLSEFYCCVRFV